VQASITPALYERRASFGAQVAQLVEHSTENAGVGCSIQPLGTTPTKLHQLVLADVIRCLDVPIIRIRQFGFQRRFHGSILDRLS
jgi:hypothetical protein